MNFLNITSSTSQVRNLLPNCPGPRSVSPSAVQTVLSICVAFDNCGKMAVGSGDRFPGFVKRRCHFAWLPSSSISLSTFSRFTSHSHFACPSEKDMTNLRNPANAHMALQGSSSIQFGINAGISHLVDGKLVADPRMGKVEIIRVS